MRQVKLILVKKLKLDIDVYILEKIHQGFLGNDEYKGLIVFDKNLKIIHKIRLFEDILIYKIFKNYKNNEILLDCQDNQKFVYINLIKKQVIYIENTKKILFSHIVYSWKELLILSTYEGRFYLFDKEKEEITSITKNIAQQYDPLLLKFKKISSEYSILRAYPNAYQFIYEDYSNKKIGFYSMLDNKNVTIPYYEWYKTRSYGYAPIHHDFQYINNGIFILISEKSIEIRKKNFRAFIHPYPEEYTFTRAIPFKVNNRFYLVTLSHNAAIISKSGYLELYYVPNFS